MLLDGGETNKAVCGIYEIKNLVNGKVYIGQSIDIRSRWIMHKWELNSGRHNNSHLQRAWDKHNRQFSFSILEVCPPGQLDAREIQWIKERRSNDPKYGYNVTTGGDGARGYKKTPEQCERLSAALKGRVGSMTGKRFSEEHKRKIAKGLAGNHNSGYGKDNHASKSVICIETGQRFECAADAGRYYNSVSSTPGTNILKACKGHRPDAFKMHWRFAE